MVDTNKEKPIQYITIPKGLLTEEMVEMFGFHGLKIHQGMIHAQSKEMGFGASLIRSGEINPHRVMRNFFHVECIGENGELKWVEDFHNLVVDEGLDDSLDKHLKGSGYTATWYVGLTDGAPVTVAAGDDMTTHAGWSDDATYSNATRPVLTLGAVSGKSVDNSGSVAAFNINGGATIGGAFVVSDSTKSGTSGILYGAGAFSGGDRAVIDGDTVNVTVTLTAAAS